MSEANNTTTTTPPRSSFVGKIADGIHRLSHDHSSHQTHQYGTDTAHDNAYIGEAGIVGAHAIPPQLGTNPSKAPSKASSKASSTHSNSSHHSYGGPENRHDNTYISEAVMAGTHAIPPMTFHARHDSKEKLKQNQKMKQPETQ
ncbi:hypothetical protein CPC16_004900 [Podila verticillata]|uniref:Uncharacterized protein n=1 Tax=Podila verticillata NRRL 6337 TaxID=1069443 RepID=A0A086TKQ3_9FUNG|nr:hypothetical protein BGZ59_009228 [Podila verticillata]KAF9390681.1 hypothetical protein CPC16_004900 [Podila verticillata]KFH62530.1 hypothetical protein MVEG_11923 [Podila verticillata NRRL 6337]